MTGRSMLQKYGFRRGKSVPPMELSPEFTTRQQALLRSWVATLPPEMTVKLPRIKVVAVGELRSPAGHAVHAAAFIRESYLLLEEPLFKSRGELGRILFHELCHFLWPRVRRGHLIYEALIRREYRQRISGELGHSATVGRDALRPDSAARRDQRWKHYVCESFCDTGAWLLLLRAGYRRRHSEWTLAASARQHRAAAWQSAVGAKILPPDKVKLTL